MDKKVKLGIKDVTSIVHSYIRSNLKDDIGIDMTKEIISATFAAITYLTKENSKGVHFQGLGTFKYIEKAKRVGRNPKTGEAVIIPTKKKFVFKESKTQSHNYHFIG